jgi:hypothetical protein
MSETQFIDTNFFPRSFTHLTTANRNPSNISSALVLWLPTVLTKDSLAAPVLCYLSTNGRKEGAIDQVAKGKRSFQVGQHKQRFKACFYSFPHHRFPAKP